MEPVAPEAEIRSIRPGGPSASESAAVASAPERPSAVAAAQGRREVLAVEVAEQRAGDLLRTFGRQQLHPGSPEAGPDGGDADRRAGPVAETAARRFRAGGGEFLQQPGPERIVHRDHRGTSRAEVFGEKPPLRLVVAVEVPVEVEVVAGEVGEDRRLEGRPAEPALFEAVRGALHRPEGAAGGAGAGEERLEVGGFAGGERGAGGDLGVVAGVDPVLDGARRGGSIRAPGGARRRAARPPSSCRSSR